MNTALVETGVVEPLSFVVLALALIHSTTNNIRIYSYSYIYIYIYIYIIKYSLEVNSSLEVQYRNISILGTRFYAEIKPIVEWEADKSLV